MGIKIKYTSPGSGVSIYWGYDETLDRELTYYQNTKGYEVIQNKDLYSI